VKPALLLIDIQHDFLQREGLAPSPADLVLNTSRLLSAMRTSKVPVMHVHTIVRADGSDRMPHWKLQNIWACVEGTSGSHPPDELLPREDEPVVAKQFYSAFDAPELLPLLSDLDIDTIIVAGLYAHGCIRATVLDAYAKGYQVLVVSDCIASTETEHSALSRSWLESRAANYVSSDSLAEMLAYAPEQNQLANVTVAPMAVINSKPIISSHHSLWRHHNPSSHEEILIQVANADTVTIAHAIDSVSQAQIKWKPSPESRQSLLETWATLLEKHRDELTAMVVLETGKPVMDAVEEINRAVSHIKSTAQHLPDWLAWHSEHSSHRVHYCPVGTIALITPWNNPVAIPVGKIAPALAFGNGVIWKPALPTSRTSMTVLQHLLDAGLPESLIAVVYGDAKVAGNIIRHPGINAVSLTGSSRTGAEVAQLCGQHNKTLQAELGGNNAAIVMADTDIGTAAQALAKSAFSFAGQRCTATRRIIIDSAIYERFVASLLEAVKALNIGEPNDVSTQVGPLISAKQRISVIDVIEQAVKHHDCKLLCGGEIPKSFEHGYWYLPTVLEAPDADCPIVQDETFGPILVIQPASDFNDAIELCNKVRQGLVASIYTNDTELQQRFLISAQAGMLRINPTDFAIHPDAPFSGWKASGHGPPEHGQWDREFYSRVQVVYN
jgi:alpha-ketoglutaric semialdehyde dehydrogenase